MTKGRVCIAAALVLLAGTAPARSGEYAVVGFGAAECSSFIQETTTGVGREHYQNIYSDWLAGFFTGINAATPDVDDILGEIEVDVAYRWIHRYCESRPMERVADAAERLHIELAKRNSDSSRPAVSRGGR